MKDKNKQRRRGKQTDTCVLRHIASCRQAVEAEREREKKGDERRRGEGYGSCATHHWTRLAV